MAETEYISADVDRCAKTRGRAEAAEARVAELEAALQALHAATDPYMENAAPGEPLTEAWAAIFSNLSSARAAAVDALQKKGKDA